MNDINHRTITYVDLTNHQYAPCHMIAVKVQLMPSGFYQVYYLWDEEKHGGMEEQWFIGGAYFNPWVAACEVAAKIQVFRSQAAWGRYALPLRAYKDENQLPDYDY